MTHLRRAHQFQPVRERLKEKQTQCEWGIWSSDGKQKSETFFRKFHFELLSYHLDNDYKLSVRMSYPTRRTFSQLFVVFSCQSWRKGHHNMAVTLRACFVTGSLLCKGTTAEESGTTCWYDPGTVTYGGRAVQIPYTFHYSTSLSFVIDRLLLWCCPSLFIPHLPL